MAVFALPSSRPRAELLPYTPGAAVPPPLWKEDLPTRVTLETNGSVPTLLILRDQLTPGWRATLDGNPVPIQRQEETQIFRVVKVPEGRHTVVFHYEPASFRLGLYLACLSLLLLFSSAIQAPLRAERNRRSQKGI